MLGAQRSPPTSMPVQCRLGESRKGGQNGGLSPAMGLNTYSQRVFRVRLFTSVGNLSKYNITFTGFKSPKIEQCEGTGAATPTSHGMSPQRSCQVFHADDNRNREPGPRDTTAVELTTYEPSASRVRWYVGSNLWK